MSADIRGPGAAPSISSRCATAFGLAMPGSGSFFGRCEIGSMSSASGCPGSAASLFITVRPMWRNVVHLPPATESIPPRPSVTTVSRLALEVSPGPPGSTRRPAKEYVIRSRESCWSRMENAASSRICAVSFSLTATSAGSPSYASSVVPSSSMSSHGRANVMRYLSIGVASAAFHGRVRFRTRCAPLDRRMEGAASGFSILRRWSTHGPVAFSTRRALTPNSVPSRRSSRSAPVTRPLVNRSPVTAAWLRTTAPASTAARTVISAIRASFIWSSP